MSIFDQGNRLTPSAIEELSKHADMVECECPTHLIAILAKVREFADYTNGCITRFPKDAKTHAWLLQSANNLDGLLSGTIAQLARFEGFIDANNEFTARPSAKSF